MFAGWWRLGRHSMSFANKFPSPASGLSLAMHQDSGFRFAQPGTDSPLHSRLDSSLDAPLNSSLPRGLDCSLLPRLDSSLRWGLDCVAA